MEHPAPGRRVHRLQHLRRRMPGQRDDARRPAGPTPLAERQGPIDRPAAAAGRLGRRCPTSTREALKPDHHSPWGDLFRWSDCDRDRARGGLDGDWSTSASPAPAPVPGRLSGRNRRRALCRPDRRRAATTRPTPSRPRSTRSRPSAAGSARRRARPPAAAGSWTSRSPSGRSSALRPSTARSPRSTPPATRRPERVAIVGGGPGRHVRGVLPRPPGLSRDRVRGDARARRHDGDRDPRVSAAARCAPGGDRADPRARGRAAAGHGDGPRLHPGDLEREGFRAIFLATGASKSRRLGVPGDELRGRHPGDAVPEAGQPRRVAAPVGPTSWSSAAAARRWTPRARRSEAAPRRSRSPIAEARRHAGPARGGRGRRA